MRKITYLLAGLSLMIFVGCNNDSELLDNSKEQGVVKESYNSVNVRNFKFENASKKERAIFFKECLDNPIKMGLIKFDRTKVKEYNMKNKALERLLIRESGAKDVYFYGEHFTIKPKNSSFDKNILAKNTDATYYYYGDSDISACSGFIYSYTSHGIVNDNCENYKMAFNLDIMFSYHGLGFTAGNRMQACAWSGDPYGDSDRAVLASPVGEVFKL